MVYAALVDEKFLPLSQKVPAPKYNSTSHRFSRSTVEYAEVDQWEEGEEIGKNQVKVCETIRLEWRRRMGLE